MNKSNWSLVDEIKKNIQTRIIASVSILTMAHIVSILFYIHLFNEKTVRQLDDLTKDLTPYIVSQEIIGDRYAIDLKIDELEKSNSVRIKWVNQVPHNMESANFSGFLIWTYTVPVVAIDNKYYGYYEISGSLFNDPWMAIGLGVQFLFLLIFILIIYFILYPLANSTPKKIFVDPINKLIEVLDKNNKEEIDFLEAPKEIIFIRDRFVELIAKQNEILKRAEILKLSEQVAHDIRSPLAAISMVVSNVSSVPEEKRILIKSAARRIQDIADNLLLRSKDSAVIEDQSDGAVESSSGLIFAIIESIVAEKKYEYQDKKISIDFDVIGSVRGCFSVIDGMVLKRILSNLVNNSIEAIGEIGSILIALSCNDMVRIIIQDNGCGIPADVLPNLMRSGYSYNKVGGAGIGLASAKKYVEQVNGNIFIESSLNVGTKVTIDLPRSIAPAWFCSEIDIQGVSRVVILDDDSSIHDAWRHRFSSYKLKLDHFYSAADLIRDNVLDIDSDLYLIDYELYNDRINGLDVIERLGLAQNAVLVTNSFENTSICKKCEDIGLKLLPKPIVPFVTIC